MTDKSNIPNQPSARWNLIGNNKFIGGWEYHEKGNSSRLCRYEDQMCMRKWNWSRLNQSQYQCGNMFQMPSVFYRETETDWHSRPHWTVSQEIREISEPRKVHLVFPRLPIIFTDKSFGRKTESDIACCITNCTFAFFGEPAGFISCLRKSNR